MKNPRVPWYVGQKEDGSFALKQTSRPIQQPWLSAWGPFATHDEGMNALERLQGHVGLSEMIRSPKTGRFIKRRGTGYRNPARVTKRAKSEARKLTRRYGSKRRARKVAGGMIGTRKGKQREHFVKVRKALKNPRTVRVPANIMAQAGKLFEDFTGHELTHAKRIAAPRLPKVLVKIGTADGLLYTTVRDGKTERYIHEFKARSRPTFAVTPDGKQLYLLGGAYNFTERGIVDKR
jgi:hypothetical protein